MDRPEHPREPSERAAERVAAGAYGTVLVLGALVLLDRDDVAHGWGWELLTGVGIATWLAHLYAEVVGDHVRHTAVPGRAELTRSMTDGLPILLAAVPPAAVLMLGRLELLDPGTALRLAAVVAAVQLVGVSLYVGLRVAPHDRGALVLAGVTAVVGAAVVVAQVSLGH
jgi:hypothetical protein